MKTKLKSTLISLLLVTLLVLALVPVSALTAFAASGTGTENDPVYVTNYAELKEALERDDDTWIVVNEFNNGNYYTLISGDDYSQTSLDDSAYACGAINIPTEKNKHLTINTTIDCRTASTQQGSLLYCFINNRGNLTIDGNGTLAVSFNAGNYANAIILNQGNLTIDAPITLDATCKSIQSYGRAIMNHSGTFTISDGTYIGFKSNTLGTLGNVGALWQASENANKESIISGGQFQIKDENGFVSNNYALVNSGVDNLTLKGGTFYGIYASQYSLKLSALLGSYCKFQKNGADFNGSSLSDSTDVLSVVNTNLISTVNLTVTAPLNGDNPSAPSISTDNVTIYAHEWKDSSESNMSSFSTFVGGETYRLQVRVNTTKEFSKNTEIYINGQKATVKSFAENTILCYCDFIASNEQIDTVQVGLDTPMVGGNVTAPYLYTSTVELTQHEWYPDVTQYEAGHNYKLTFRIVPKTGYEFSEDVRVVINGKQATITSQGEDFAICEYSFEFAAQEPETVDEIIITVDNPVAGGTSPTPTVSSNQYTLGMHEWTPSEFDAGSNSKLTVLAYPSSGYKFVDGTTTAKVNGQTATISIGNGYARIEYTFIVSTPSYTVSFNANGGTGSMLDETDQFGGFVLPDCTFTAPSGKQLKCWAEGSESGNQYAPREEYNVTSNVTFYAVWETIPATKYDVVYGIGEGQGSGSSERVDEGTEITLDSYETIGMVAPNGQVFDYWSIRIGTAQSAETARKQPNEKITINADTYIIAIWKDAPITNYTITATAGANGSISPSGGVTVAAGEDKTFTITASSGYHIKDVKVNGSSVGAVSTYTFNDVAANATITVEFEVDTVPHVCNPTLVPEDEPNCLTAGKSAYYHCECGKNYEDVEGNTEITNLETWGILNALGHNPSTAWSTDGEYHWKECTRCAGQQLEKSAHSDSNNDGKCDVCEYQTGAQAPDTPSDPSGPTDPSDPTEPTDPQDPDTDKKKGLGTGAIIAIVLGSILAVLAIGVGIFALVWFVVKKKTFADIKAIFTKQ